MEKPLYRPTQLVVATLLLSGVAAYSQTTSPPAQQPAPAAPPPQGEVLFQSHGAPPTSPDNAQPSPGDSASNPARTASPAGPPLTDKERSAILVTGYDLDARLTPATSRLSMRARLTLRNTASEPLSRIALQISSTLHWESTSLIPTTDAAPTKLPLAQHLIDTDADHTGKANEAIVTLPKPLAPGASVSLDTFYAGIIAASPGRLTRIGASPEQALAADWDAIGATPTSSSSSGPAQQPTLDAALRGFGDVLWYPVAEPQLFLGQGAELFHAIERNRLREQHASIHLRVAVEYNGDPPVAVYFCGRRQPLVALPDDPDAPVVTGHGIARAEFTTEPIGFRLPSLFVVDSPESMIASLPGSASSPPAGPSAPPSASSDSASSDSSTLTSNATHPSSVIGPVTAPMLAVETTDDGALPRLADSAESIAPLLQKWFGARPLTALTILDHDGQPFEDCPLLVAPIDSLSASDDSAALAHSLTHAWVQTGQPWMDEGLAEFVSLLWTEQQKGREAAIKQLDDLVQPLALTEPDFAAPSPQPAPSAAPSAPSSSSSSSRSLGAPSSPTPGGTASSSAKVGSGDEPLGEPLISASQASYYGAKAAAVWWMLRDIAGDDPLREALSAWRTQPVSHASPQAQAEAFEHLLEKTSGKDLAWFFDDWVLRDRGLPDLTIVDVTPRQLPAGPGRDTGWIVAVTLRNRGAAAAEVPVILRSGDLGITKRMRIAGFSEATDRVVIESAPTEVVVNDGSVPEVGASTHTLTIVHKTE